MLVLLGALMAFNHFICQLQMLCYFSNAHTHGQGNTLKTTITKIKLLITEMTLQTLIKLFAIVLNEVATVIAIKRH